MPKASFEIHLFTLLFCLKRKTDKLEVENLNNLLQSETLQNEVLKRQLADLQMQLDLNNTKLNVTQ